jgi:hypothetical protein
MAKLRWAEIDGMKYVAVPEDDYDHCRKCAFLPDDMTDYCNQVECASITFIPLEPQHIPHLRVKGKTKWLR